MKYSNEEVRAWVDTAREENKSDITLAYALVAIAEIGYNLMLTLSENKVTKDVESIEKVIDRIDEDIVTLYTITDRQRVKIKKLEQSNPNSGLINQQEEIGAHDLDKWAKESE